MFKKNGGEIFGTVGKLILTVSLVTTAGLIVARTKQETSGIYMSSETRIFDKDSPYAYSEMLEFAESVKANADEEPEIEYLTEAETEPETDAVNTSEKEAIGEGSSETAVIPAVTPETVSDETTVSEGAGVSYAETVEITVYWVKSGEVWHLSEKCPSLSRSKTILSGTVDEAMASGKDRVCKRCGK